MTRRAGERAEDSQVLRDLLDAGTEVVCLVGKAWDLHVTEALRTDLDEGVAMVRDSVAFLRAQGRRVFFDAEHFFDGYQSDPAFAMAVLAAAEEAGAERLVLCDTNGGMLPFDVARIVAAVQGPGRRPARDPRPQRRGLRGRELARRGRRRRAPGAGNGQRLRRAHRQRRHRADHGRPRAQDGRRRRAAGRARSRTSPSSRTTWPRSRTSRPRRASPTRAGYAFTHKAGLHTSGVARVSRAYEHVEPDAVGQPSQRRRVRLQRRRLDPDEGRRVRAGSRRRRDPCRGAAAEGPRVRVATPTT